ncbi:MAG TPA: SDR family NAD(P)-dependent oxidoreductase [Acidimicrobiia bacterium]|jgi:NAD(P)-dependent dehydrogenase (short-subunit alcohol dehydrogenase family)
MELTGKRFVVAGAGRGIGLAVADVFAAEGAIVARVDLDFEGEASGVGQSQLVCDISSRAAVEATFAVAVEQMGGLDGLVNTAGIERRVPAEELTDADWDAMLDVHLRGTFLTNQVAFRYLCEGGGRIVNFGSHAGLQPAVHASHYAAAKGGVIAWTRSVAQEWGQYGITVNCVLPAMRTPMYDEYRERLSVDELRLHDERMAQQIAIGGRLGDPATDLAPVLVFLAGDGSRFITGQLIAVTGGFGTTR